jgi:hypothetical protein
MGFRNQLPVARFIRRVQFAFRMIVRDMSGGPSPFSNFCVLNYGLPALSTRKRFPGKCGNVG